MLVNDDCILVMKFVVSFGRFGQLDNWIVVFNSMNSGGSKVEMDDVPFVLVSADTAHRLDREQLPTPKRLAHDLGLPVFAPL